MIVGVTFSTNRGLRALDAVRRLVRRLSIFVNVSVERWLERATRRETRSPCYFFAAIGPLFYTYIVLVSFTCDIEGRSFDGADGSVCSATVLLLCRTVVSGERTREREGVEQTWTGRKTRELAAVSFVKSVGQTPVAVLGRAFARKVYEVDRKARGYL